jgi:hypothetical protein
MSNEDTLRALGKPAPDTAVRDAVHIAVIPITAAEELKPGAHVGVLLDGTASTDAVKPIGLVDPFLKTKIKQGARFFLFLYPGSITSLHHHWTHPSFPEESEAQLAKMEAEDWIRRWANNMDITGGFDYVIEVALANTFGGGYGEYISEGDKFQGADVPAEFWENFETYIGRTVPTEKRNGFFSCSY